MLLVFHRPRQQAKYSDLKYYKYLNSYKFYFRKQYLVYFCKDGKENAKYKETKGKKCKQEYISPFK